MLSVRVDTKNTWLALQETCHGEIQPESYFVVIPETLGSTSDLGPGLVPGALIRLFRACPLCCLVLCVQQHGDVSF